MTVQRVLVLGVAVLGVTVSAIGARPLVGVGRAMFWNHAVGRVITSDVSDDLVGQQVVRKNGGTQPLYQPRRHVAYTFTDGGREFGGLLVTSTAGRSFRPGDTLTVWFRRSDPTANTASRHVPITSILLLVVGLGFIATAYWLRP